MRLIFPPGDAAKSGCSPRAGGHAAAVAVRNVLVEASPEQVWSVLADGWAYRDWVVGTREIRAVDDGWPAVGTSIHFTAGGGPLTVRDRTTVRISEPNHRLELEAHAPMGTARIAIRLEPWDDECLVVMDEHPLRGAGFALHTGLLEAFLQLRHRRMLRLLANVVERRSPR